MRSSGGWIGSGGGGGVLAAASCFSFGIDGAASVKDRLRYLGHRRRRHIRTQQSASGVCRSVDGAETTDGRVARQCEVSDHARATLRRFGHGIVDGSDRNAADHDEHAAHGKSRRHLCIQPSPLQIWIMSRYYNDDQKMGGLFRKIAIQIGDRAEAAVDIKTLFKQDAGHTTALLANATHMLEAWYTAYMQVGMDPSERGFCNRTRVSRFARRSKLLDATLGGSSRVRCSSNEPNIWRWCVVISQRWSTSSTTSSSSSVPSSKPSSVRRLASHIPSQTSHHSGETSGIDQILETVVVMCEAVEAVPFDVFDVACSEPWSKVKAQFHTDNESIKQSTRELIDASFRKLRSSEAAFELLKSFESIQSRGAIQQQIMSKAKDVLRQFSREMDVARSIFDVHQQHPPVARNQPPVAGSIQWSRRLFARIKRTMTKLASFLTDLRQDVIGTSRGWQDRMGRA